MHVLSGQAAFDDKRNSSAFRPPAPNAVRDALNACANGRGKDWYDWVIAFGRQEHRHDLRMQDGKPAACPVRHCDAPWGS